MKKKIVILGSTGSIGKSTLEVLKKDKIKMLLAKKQIQHSESKFLFSLLNVAMIESLNESKSV